MGTTKISILFIQINLFKIWTFKKHLEYISLVINNIKDSFIIVIALLNVLSKFIYFYIVGYLHPLLLKYLIIDLSTSSRAGA